MLGGEIGKIQHEYSHPCELTNNSLLALPRPIWEDVKKYVTIVWYLLNPESYICTKLTKHTINHILTRKIFLYLHSNCIYIYERGRLNLWTQRPTIFYGDDSFTIHCVCTWYCKEIHILTHIRTEKLKKQPTEPYTYHDFIFLFFISWPIYIHMSSITCFQSFSDIQEYPRYITVLRFTGTIQHYTQNTQPRYKTFVPLIRTQNYETHTPFNICWPKQLSDLWPPQFPLSSSELSHINPLWLHICLSNTTSTSTAYIRSIIWI